jgi:PAS domain S-box-containing protein
MIRVLVVDHLPARRESLCTLFKANDCEVDEARHGAEALLMARRRVPDVIVAELLMPVMDGFTLLRHWRADPQLQAIAFVVYTADSTDARDEQLTLSLGADAFIARSAQSNVLMDRVSAVLEQARHRKLKSVPQLPVGASEGSTALSTEHLHAEVALRESAERLRLAVRASNVGLWDWNLITREVTYSREWKSQLGYEDHEIGNDVGEWESRVHANDLAAARSQLKGSMEGPMASFEVEFRMRHKDGSWRWISSRGQIFRDAGKPARMLGCHLDITARKQAEAALRDSEAKFAAAFRASPAASGLLAPDGRYVEVNQTLCDLIGYSREEVIGKRAIDLGIVSEEESAKLLAAMERKGGALGDIELRMRVRDGSFRDTVSSSTVISLNGVPHRLSTGIDITERKRAEAALRESELKFSVAFRSSPVAIAIIGPDGRYVESNEASCKLLGHSREELIGNTVADVGMVLAEDMEKLRENLKRGGGTASNVELRMRVRDGSFRDIAFSTVEVLLNGAPHRISTALDITERKRAEAALHESEVKFSAAFRSSPVVLAIIGPNDEYVEVNQAFCKLLGYSREEVLGRRVGDLAFIPEESRLQLLEGVTRASGSFSSFELRVRARDGTYRDTLSSSTIILLDGVPHRLSSALDITDLKRAEERLRQLNRTYAVLSDINQLIVREREPQALLDQACRIAVEKGGFLLAWIGMTAAPGDRLCLKAHAGATPGTRAVLDLIFSDTTVDCVVTSRALETGVQSVCNDIEHELDPAPWREASLRRGYRAMASFPLTVHERHVGTFNLYAGREDFFDAEELRLLDGLARDIAFALEVREHERERHALQQQLAQSQKMQAIGTLAGGIAHDFNNLLAAILGNADLARMDLGAAHPAQPSIKEIVRASLRAKELVQRILTFSRPQEHPLRPIQLPPVLEEAMRLLRSTIPAGVAIQLHCAPAVPAVQADASQIHQIILNLATNAWHAMDNQPGSVDIRVEPCRVDSMLCQLHPELQPGPYVRLSVSDTGKGMDAATLGRIFEPFFTTKAAGQGTGLGLSVVHGIVRSHGGAIVVESAPGLGSHFHLYFPASMQQADPTQIERAGAGEIRGCGEHILYLDDEEPLVYLAVRFLERRGYRVDGYTRAEEALAAFRANPRSYDLVITDYNMPGMSGMEVARELLRIRPAAPIALASGYVRPTEIEQARALGISEIILKPNTVEELGPVVARLLARQTPIGNEAAASGS